MSGYSFVFFAPCCVSPNGPNIFKIEPIFYMIHFKVATQSGESWNGYVQFLTKKTVEELQWRFPGYMFQQSTNDPAVYGSFAGFQHSLDGVHIYGQPRYKTPSNIRNMNPLKACKKKLKKKMTDMLCQVLVPEHLIDESE